MFHKELIYYLVLLNEGTFKDSTVTFFKSSDVKLVKYNEK